MCMLSVVYDYGRQKWPNPNPFTVTPTPWSPPSVQPLNPKRPLPTHDEWEALKAAIKAAREFDEAAGEAECEDPEKVAWFEEVDARLTALEADRPGPHSGGHFSNGVQAIDAERFRQVQVLGYDAAHDADDHQDGELAEYAQSYIRAYLDPYNRHWGDLTYLAKAGALLAAEIDKQA